jgi:DNA-binding NtrC family response regulator
LDLSEVQKAMVPGAKEVLKTGIGLDAGKEAFLLTTISVALEESGGNQNLAARKLGISQSYISQAVNGKTLVRFRGKKKPAELK